MKHQLLFRLLLLFFCVSGNIWAVVTQNEIAWSPNWPCCTWCAKDLKNFIGEFLYPQLEKDKMKSEIWLRTINYPNPDYARKILNTKELPSRIKGVGFQCSGGESLSSIHREFPLFCYPKRNAAARRSRTDCQNGCDRSALVRGFLISSSATPPCSILAAKNVAQAGKVISLSATSGGDESPHDNPKKIYPNESSHGGFAQKFGYDFKPFLYDITHQSRKKQNVQYQN